MKKIYKILLSTLVVVTTVNLSAQSTIEFDVVNGSDGSYPELFKTIGNRMFFQYEEPTMDYYEAPAYLKENGEVVKLKWPQGFITDGYDSDFYELNGQPIWVQYVYDSAEDEYYTAISIERNDSIVFLTDYNNGDYAYNLSVYNNKAYFSYYVDTLGYELFAYDGNSVSLVQDLNPGSLSSYPEQFVLHNNKLMFNINTLSGDKVIETDGSIFTELNLPRIGSYNERQYASNGNDLYYVSNYTYPQPLIHYDGVNVDTINNDVNGTQFGIYQMHMADNELYMNGYAGGYRLVKFNSTNDSLELVAPNVLDIYVAESYSDTMFFTGYNTTTSQNGLFLLVPGIDTAVMVVNYYVNAISAVGTELFFSLDDDNIGSEPYIWKNGAPELLADINTWGSSSSYSFELFGGQLLVDANTNMIGKELVALCLTPVTAPTVPATQIICEDAMVSDLNVNGNNVVFYETNTAQNAIDPMDVISNYTTVFVTSNQVCASDRVEVPYTVSILPQTPVAHYGEGLLKVIVPNSAYQWMDCQTGDSIQGENGQTFQANANGAYQCIITNSDGCSAVSDCIYVVNLSVAENLANTVKVYPNPASQFITLEATEAMKSVELVSLAGQVVATQQVNGTLSTLSLDNMTDGVYLLNVYGQNGEQIAKHRVVVNK